MNTASDWRWCVAPMMDWTHRHCRYFHRLLSSRVRLYTEMIHSGALLYGNPQQHLDFDSSEHPLALQLGGSDPIALGKCAVLAQNWGYDEVNLNCGCPSPRVQEGSFGACLMGNIPLVQDCMKAMQDACTLPVTIKHRTGLGRENNYSVLRDFIGALTTIGVSTFIIHARNAWLEGLSPAENRSIPPLRYPDVWQIKKDFPTITVVLNGGLNQASTLEHLGAVDGVMLGRAAWDNPWHTLTPIDNTYTLSSDRDNPSSIPHLATNNSREANMHETNPKAYSAENPPHESILYMTTTPRLRERREVALAMQTYAWQQTALGTPLSCILMPMLGLYHGEAGSAKIWRRTLSDSVLQKSEGAGIITKALKAIGEEGV